MDLAFKPDFAAARARWMGFWDGSRPGPMIGATVPKAGREPTPKPGYSSGHDGDFGPVIDQLLGWAESHEFLGDAIPFFYLEFGADQFATFLGAEMRFPEGIDGYGWVDPCIPDIAAADLRFRPESEGWQRISAFARELRRRCDGALLIAAPSLVANLDALAAACGTSQLLLELVDRPEAVRRALEQIDAAHVEILAALADLLDVPAWGSINRHGFYAAGPINMAQCDFSCMIGSSMFDEFALPFIRRELSRYDGGEYHLDGPDAIRHVGALATLPELDIFQWVPGAGNEKRDWSGLYRQFHQLGKGQVRGVTPDGVDAMRQAYPGSKLVLNLGTRDRDAAMRAIAAVHG